MPAVSVDTFFACSLMVMLVLSAMTVTSNVLYPYLRNNVGYDSRSERSMETSRYLLLNTGVPADWGQSGSDPETFGLAKSPLGDSCNLDIDKVSRLNEENTYAVGYAQAFTSLQMPDISFRIEIKPVFQVSIDLARVYNEASNAIYEFHISTHKDGFPISSHLKPYVIADNYLNSTPAFTSECEVSYNVTITDTINGPVLFVILARSIYNERVASFGSYAFAHNSPLPASRGTFLRMSPLNFSLNVSRAYSSSSLAETYALAFSYNSTLTQTWSDNWSAIYEIPRFQDSSPIFLVTTGHNSSVFFSEWLTYPQVPLTMGADFSDSSSLTGVFASRYIITVNSAQYMCTIWTGGPSE